jgi:molecular chaperone GrpE (heat shock protein)
VLRQAEAHPSVDPSPLIVGLIAAHDLAAGNLAVSQRVEQVLAGAGIRRIDAAPGTPFDTALHECVDTEPGGSAAPVVTRQVRPGWAGEHELLRPVEVVVAVG